MGSGYNKRKKQAKLLQEQFLKMQEELKQKEVEGVSGNGLVRITLNGEQEVKSIKIKPECVDPEDIEGLEDLLVAAFRDAQKQLNQGDNGMAGLADMPGMPDMSAFGL